MSDQEFGQAVESSQELTPMPSEAPSEPSESTDLTPREGANELSDRRQEPGRGEDPPDIISLRDQQGKRTDRRVTLKLDEAGKGLANYREQKVQAAERQEQELVRQHADALRSGRQSPIDAVQQRQPDTQQQPRYDVTAALQQGHAAASGEMSEYDRQLFASARDPQTRQNVKFTQQALAQRMQELDSQIAGAYSQGQNWTELGREYLQLQQSLDQIGFVDRAMHLMEGGLSPKIATSVADAEVLSYIQRNVNVYEEGYKLAVEKHATDCMELIGAIESVMYWMFPELQHARTIQEIQNTINAVRKSNPSRADDISKWYSQFEQAAEVGRQAVVRNEQQKREKFKVWATNQDNIFRANNPEFIGPAHQRQVAEEAFAYLESLGVTREETEKLHDEDIMFRSHVGQQVLLDALRYRQIQKARQTLPSKRYQAPATTIKPGSAETYLEPRVEQMPSRFDGLSGIREAAAILSNRRARRK